MANSTTTLDTIQTAQAQKEVTANALFDAVSPGTLFGRRASTTSALTWGYYGGTMLVNGALTQIANGTIALTASATNYLESDQSGTVSVNTTGFTAGKVHLYQIVTGTASVTSYTDYRITNYPVFGSSSISVAGASNVTLSAGQSRNEILTFTGSLTANIAVIFPAVPFAWIVYNSTSGAHTLTAKTASGTGILIPQGQRTLIMGDGTNIYAVSEANGVNHQTGTTYAIQTVDLKQLITFSNAAAIAVTIAQAGSSFPNGWMAYLVNEGAGTVTVTPTTSTVDGAANFTLATGESAILFSDGTNYFTVRGGGSGGGSTLPVFDTVALVKNATDSTKQVRLDASLLTTGVTRVASMPDKNGTLAMLSDLPAGGAGASDFGYNSGGSSALSYAYYAGNYSADNVVTTVSAGTLALSASSTNYVELNTATGTVSSNTTGFTAGLFPLSIATTDATTITGVTDKRTWVRTLDLLYLVTFKGYSETTNSNAAATGAVTVDLTTGNIQRLTLTGNVTLTISNPAASGKSSSVTLWLTQDATGSRTVTWPTGTKWSAGIAPVLSTAAGAVDIVTLTTFDGGTTWFGFLAGQGMA